MNRVSELTGVFGQEYSDTTQQQVIVKGRAMTPAHAREVFVVLTHLALWSQLGVLTRIYLDKLFSNGCNGSWGICLSSEGGPLESVTMSDATPFCQASQILRLSCLDLQGSVVTAWALISRTLHPICWAPS